MTRRSAALPVLFFLWSSTASAVETLDQSNEVEPSSAIWCSVRTGITWWQSFVPSSLDGLTRVELLVQFPFNLPTDPLNVAIVTTDLASIPTTTVIASTTVTAAEAIAGLGGLKKGWLSVPFASPVSLTPGTKYAIRVSSPAAEIRSYEWRAAQMSPGIDPYPAGQMWLSTGGSPGGRLSDALFRTWHGTLNDLDGDGIDDAVDPDDDGDGTDDIADNCPIDFNPAQSDDDHDGLGNTCDPEFNSDTATAGIQEDAADAISLLTVANPPGVNGLIAKLSGNGSVPAKVSRAYGSFTSGAIDHDAYVALLVDALLQLDGLDAQVAAKLEAGTLTPEEAELIFAETDAIRSTTAALATQ